MKGLGIVTTKYGKLSGVEYPEAKYAGVTYFKGVPYAKPPVGELRWKPPVDPEPWEGVRACNKFGARCPQIMDSGLGFEPYASDFYFEPHPPMSEDCLYLNIATAAESADEKRPVYMWFHGGGLSTGYASEIEFDPAELARKGIVVVTVGQRLNIIGYLALPQLDAEQGGKSGNYGLMDEIKALDWVYENIAAFGGDPENITIGGQSGGTAKSGALACSPAQKGRVKRVINQSSLNWTSVYQTLEEAENNAKAYLAAIGIDPDMPLDELRKLPANAFYSDAVNGFLSPGPRLPGSMICDGEIVPYINQAQAFAENASYCDYLTGGNYGESAMRKGFILGGASFSSAKEFYEVAKDMLGDLYEKYDFENLIAVTDSDANLVSRKLACRGLTGHGGGMFYRYFGAYRKAKGMTGKTYSYIFAHVTPTRPEDKGTRRDRDRLLAWHSSELWYTFASLRDGVPPARPWSESDFRLADQMSSYWANFMKTGDPNGEGLPYWPESDENYGYMELGTFPTAHPSLEGRVDEMLLEYIANSENTPK